MPCLSERRKIIRKLVLFFFFALLELPVLIKNKTQLKTHNKWAYFLRSTVRVCKWSTWSPIYSQQEVCMYSQTHSHSSHTCCTHRRGDPHKDGMNRREEDERSQPVCWPACAHLAPRDGCCEASGRPWNFTINTKIKQKVT